MQTPNYKSKIHMFNKQMKRRALLWDPVLHWQDTVSKNFSLGPKCRLLYLLYSYSPDSGHTMCPVGPVVIVQTQ